jgi:hypothetical protein
MGSKQHDLVRFGGPGWALDKALEVISVRHAGTQAGTQFAYQMTAQSPHSSMPLRHVSWWLLVRHDTGERYVP